MSLIKNGMDCCVNGSGGRFPIEDIDKGKQKYKEKEANRLIDELKGILNKAKEEYEYDLPSR